MNCMRCGKDHDGSYGSGRFCSSSCSHVRVNTAESNRRRSEKMMGHHYNKGQIPWNKGKRVGRRASPKCWGYVAPNKIPVSEVIAGLHPNMPTYVVRNKLLAEGLIEDRCSECGWSRKRDGYRFSTCHLHHKNGNKRDHRIENLVLLCPNCHSITPTYGKLKKSVGREPIRTFDDRNKAVIRNAL